MYGKSLTTAKDGVKEKPSIEHAVCCCWVLPGSEAESLQEHRIQDLHAEVAGLVEFFGAQTLEVSATQGLIRCDASSQKARKCAPMSSEDVALRLGQLICRWASEQHPPITVKVGVHTGQLSLLTVRFNLVNRTVCYGSAATVARQLAHSAPSEFHVHFLSDTRSRLSEFQYIPLLVCKPTQSYCLEAWSITRNDGAADLYSHRRLEKNHLAVESQRVVVSSSLSEFAELLKKHQIDVNKFGKGRAKTLLSFHSELRGAGRSSLVILNGSLVRWMEVLRIAFYFTADDGREVHVKVREIGREQLFHRLQTAKIHGELELNAIEALAALLGVERSVLEPLVQVMGCGNRAMQGVSPTLPSIPTIYVTHEVDIKLLETRHEALRSAVSLTGEEVITTSSEGAFTWKWMVVGNDNTSDALISLLESYAIPVYEMTPKDVQALHDELYQSHLSRLAERNGELSRYVYIVQVSIRFDVLNVPYTLLLHSKDHMGEHVEEEKLRHVSMRIASDADWHEAVQVVLAGRLGLSAENIRDGIVIDSSSYKLSEEVQYSASFPGLKTVYHIHEATCHATIPFEQWGLPQGNDFCVALPCLDPASGSQGLTKYMYVWKPLHEYAVDTKVKSGYERSLADCKARAEEKDAEKKKVPLYDPKRKVPHPQALSVPVTSDKNCILVEELMRGKATNWNLARRAAKRIRDEDYNLKMFLEDCQGAFPELQLYMVGADLEGGAMTSGRTADEEYQRSIGALFAVYWLMRLNTDGAQSFCFGVGDDFAVLSPSSASPRRDPKEVRARSTFKEQLKWELFEETLTSGGLLIADPTDPKKIVGHDEDRTLAMLVLTAIHDVMKVSILCPTVVEGEFCGYKVGEQIGDHDVALGYILEKVPNALPSYAGLPEKQRDSVRFTQCRMEYNMGWLVQAEAPPGALFSNFKNMIRSGGAAPEDISFYFTHWLTDLAGAEPCPMDGCEKFVLKFPNGVLMSFLSSFQFVERLSRATETEVYEDYLCWRWNTASPRLGDVPTSFERIALLRLAAMAQSCPGEVLEGFARLSMPDKLVLAEELSLTGCPAQMYNGKCHMTNLVSAQSGPAFLIYYAPALLQANGKQHAKKTLQVLAEVLRAARSLWPATSKDVARSVILRIDALKDKPIHTLIDVPHGWILSRTSGKDACVKVYDMKTTGEVDWQSTRILNFFTSLECDPSNGGSAEADESSDIEGKSVMPRLHKGNELRDRVLEGRRHCIANVDSP